MRVPISYALHFPERADVADASRSTWPLSASSRSSRPTRDVPLPRARTRGGGGRRHGALRPERRQRGRGRTPSSRGRLAFLDIPRVIEGTLEAADNRPVHAASRTSTTPTRRRAASPPASSSGSR